MRGSGGEGLQKLPLHRRIEFAPVTDPVSGTMSVMVTEDDISHIKAALEDGEGAGAGGGGGGAADAAAVAGATLGLGRDVPVN